jgi:hypothetical protein
MIRANKRAEEGYPLLSKPKLEEPKPEKIKVKTQAVVEGNGDTDEAELSMMIDAE